MVDKRWVLLAAAAAAVVIATSALLVMIPLARVEATSEYVAPTISNPFAYRGPWTPPGTNESVKVDQSVSENDPVLVHLGSVTFGLWWDDYPDFLGIQYSNASGGPGNYTLTPINCPNGDVTTPACNGGPEEWTAPDGHAGVWIVAATPPLVYVWVS